jgi:hypothetical protein
MALLKREIRQVKGPEVTHADRCTLVFDTDTKSLYVEREVAHLDASVDGTIEMQTAKVRAVHPRTPAANVTTGKIFVAIERGSRLFLSLTGASDIVDKRV